MRFFIVVGLSVASLGVWSCSSTSSDTDGGTDAQSDGTVKPDAAGNDSATNDASEDAAGDSSTDAGKDGAVTLKINDYLHWCNVAVNGGSVSAADPQTFEFAPNTVVNLSGDLASKTFVWGYWVGTDGDTDAGHDTSKVTTVTLKTSDVLIQACCPFASSPNTPCPPPQ